MPVFLRVGDLPIEQAIPFRSILRASRAYRVAGLRFGAHRVSVGALYLAPDAAQIDNEPDFTLAMRADGTVSVRAEKERRYD